MGDKIELDAAGIEAALQVHSPHLFVPLTHEQRMSDDYAFTNRRDAIERDRKKVAKAVTAYLSASKAVPEAPVGYVSRSDLARLANPQRSDDGFTGDLHRRQFGSASVPLFASPPKTYEDGPKVKELVDQLRTALAEAEYQPGDHPVIPVRIAAFMDKVRALIGAPK